MPPTSRFRIRHDSELGELHVCCACRRVYALDDEAARSLHRCDPHDLGGRSPWYAIAAASVLVAVLALAALIGVMRALGSL